MKIFKIILFSFLLFILGTTLAQAATVTDSVTVYVTGNCTNGAINPGCTICQDGSTTTPNQSCPDIKPMGVLNGYDCEIEPGQGACQTNLSWDINPTIAGAATGVTKTGWQDVTGVGAKSTDSVSDFVSYGSMRYYLYHGGIEVSTKDIKASCKEGDFWDGKVCANDTLDRDRWREGWNRPCSTQCDQPEVYERYECLADDGCDPEFKIRQCDPTDKCQAPSATIDVSPNSIRIGQSVKVKWSSVGMVSCTSDNLNFSTGGNPSGEETKTGLQKSTTYSMTCIDDKGKTYTAKDFVSVDTSTIIEI